MLTKKYGELNTFMSIMLDRNNAECLNVETFHKEPGFTVSCENVLTNNYVQMGKVL